MSANPYHSIHDWQPLAPASFAGRVAGLGTDGYASILPVVRNAPRYPDRRSLCARRIAAVSITALHLH